MNCLLVHKIWWHALFIFFPLDECWEDNNDSEDDIIVEAPDQPVQQEALPEGYNEAESLVKWLTIFFLRLHGRHYVPDSAMNNLFKFILRFFKSYREVLNLLLSTLFPSSLLAARKINGCEQSDQILSYLVCPHSECFVIHEHTSCSLQQGGCKCSRNQFPNHPMLHFCQPCESSLLKSVYLSSGRHIYYPLKIYCYYSL